MCSIAGIINKKNKVLNVEKFYDDSFDLMKKRGPDNQKFIQIDSICSLGHQRLSIIDLSDEGNQPMSFEELTIVFNGEIYNYVELKDDLKKHGVNFETNSDTEVLLKGYVKNGVLFFNKLNGMFAFAIYNKKTNELLLVRDRFGVKPLHYMVQNDVMYFSSEIKPLLNIKEEKNINISVYKSFFEHTATDYDEKTFVEGIYQVKAGHFIKIKEKLEDFRWYFGCDFFIDETIFENKESTLNFVEETLVSAISYRMRADVPICLTLSGGIDSTTLYTLIKERLHKDVKLFTFVHPGSDTNEYDKVIKLASFYNDIICVVKSDNADNFEKLKEDLHVVEFPIWGVSTRAYRDMYDSINKSGFKVVIEGHGSDEQLGGYAYMAESAFYDYLKKFNILKAIEMLKLMHETRHPQLGNKSSFYETVIRSIGKFILNNKNIKLFQENIDWTFDFKILPIVLRAFDRLSMGSSIESRAPFMDYRVVELFKKLPIEYKINKIGNKAILREILKKYKKTYIYEDKKKMGFSSDLKLFFNNYDNKKNLKHYIEKFDMKEFESQKDKALELINQEKILWLDTLELSKIATVSMINEKYGFTKE
jgi:asparagine synthase (glutamine-hydrolysing)